MTSEAADIACAIDLDGWKPGLVQALWNDPDMHGVRTAIRSLASLLASLVERPEEVTLVVAIDLAEAVMRRDPSRPYTTDRGSGMVGGRTMQVDDGRIDVIFDANWLVALDENRRLIPNQAGIALMNRSITHEAQHVIMAQCGSDLTAYGRSKIPGFMNVHMFDAASNALDEHRAECGAIKLAGKKPPTRGDVEDVLGALGGQLSVVDAAYRTSRNAPQLAYGAMDACGSVWVAMAYWAAAHRTGDGITPLPAEITDSTLWHRYVGDTWDAIASAMCLVPVSDLATPPDVLHSVALTMSAALRESLNTIGFHYTDDETGSAFYVHRHDFPSA
ncbi:hypothetical protein [Tomitella biformata]|uniref:hypothetical protein n=1 Tax=Tomitella biformata TaxID=630403 RepID=UPI00057184C3|nr:hypothetical protein [Tomitella biformata]